jgi:hypothetical protein
MSSIGGSISQFQSAVPGFYPVEPGNNGGGASVGTRIAFDITGAAVGSAGISDNGSSADLPPLCSFNVAGVQLQVGSGSITTVNGSFSASLYVFNDVPLFNINLADIAYGGIVLPAGVVAGGLNGASVDVDGVTHSLAGYCIYSSGVVALSLGAVTPNLNVTASFQINFTVSF